MNKKEIQKKVRNEEVTLKNQEIEDETKEMIVLELVDG